MNEETSNGAASELELAKPPRKLTETEVTKLMVEILKPQRLTYETWFDACVKAGYERFEMIITLTRFRELYDKLVQSNQIHTEQVTTYYIALGGEKVGT